MRFYAIIFEVKGSLQITLYYPVNSSLYPLAFMLYYKRKVL